VQVALSAVWIDQLALVIFGDGIDGEIAALQVFFEGDVGAGMEGKPAIATTAFALGARQGVFLAGLRVQENREVRTDRAKPLACISSGVAPTTSQSTSVTWRPNRRSRTAPPTL